MSNNEQVPATVAEPLDNITVYDRISDPMTAIKTLGNSIFKSGIFGIDKPEQGEVIAMECLAQRKSPLELARTYHFIAGRLAIKSDALLAKFQQAGGTVNWITRTDKIVEADFCKDGSCTRIVATIEEYTANGVATGANKETWRKWPRRMLTARAIGEGVRLVCPEAAFGTYTVEELDVAPSFKAKSTIQAMTLDDYITDDLRESAVEVLRKVGHLTADQGWSDISDELKTTLAHPKRVESFLQAVKKNLNK